MACWRRSAERGAALALVVACRRTEPPAPPPEASPAPLAADGGGTPVAPGLGDVKARVGFGLGGDGERLTFSSGIARESASGVEIVLSTAAVACDADAGDGKRLTLTLPRGPKGDFFGGAPIGVPLRLPGSADLPAFGVRATLSIAGARARGTLAFEDQFRPAGADAGPYRGSLRTQGRGSFDVPVCPSASAGPPRLADVGPRPLSGSVVVLVRTHRWTMFRYVSAVLVYAAAPVDCGAVFAGSPRPELRLVDLGGGGEVGFALDRPQPARAFAGGEAPSGEAWVRLDASPLYDRDRVTGALGAVGPGERREGAFDARVCVVPSWDTPVAE